MHFNKVAYKIQRLNSYKESANKISKFHYVSIPFWSSVILMLRRLKTHSTLQYFILYLLPPLNEISILRENFESRYPSFIYQVNPTIPQLSPGSRAHIAFMKRTSKLPQSAKRQSYKTYKTLLPHTFTIQFKI